MEAESWKKMLNCPKGLSYELFPLKTFTEGLLSVILGFQRIVSIIFLTLFMCLKLHKNSSAYRSTCGCQSIQIPGLKLLDTWEHYSCNPRCCFVVLNRSIF